MTAKRKPILVTGSHRSGTTWVGKCLGNSKHAAYLHEPFNPSIKLHCIKRPLDYWYQYIDEANAEKYQKSLDHVIRLRYPFFENLGRTPRDADHILMSQLRILFHKIRDYTPILKDPLAFFSAQWLTRTYGMNTLVMIRHPAAFCSSLKLKKWEFDFRHFLDQSRLMDKYLNRYEKEIHEFSARRKDIIEQGCLLWNCIHHVIHMYQNQHPEWLFVRHEDLSRDPLGQFKPIFRKLDLEFTPQVKNFITETSSAHNSAEQKDGSEFKRDSRSNIYNWKKRLTKSEILLIRTRTDEVSHLFYDDTEW